MSIRVQCEEAYQENDQDQIWQKDCHVHYLKATILVGEKASFITLSQAEVRTELLFEIFINV